MNYPEPNHPGNLVEDPAISPLIDDLKHRWPAIGNAVDHPLTEFFIRRTLRKGIRRRGIDPKFYQIATFLCVVCFFLSIRYFPGLANLYMRFNGLILLLVFGGIALNRKFRKPPRRNDLASPFHMLAEAGDVSQWEHLWLAPLSYRDVAGTCIGVFYHTRVSKKWLPHLTGAFIVLSVIFLLLLNMGAFRNLIGNQYLFPVIALGSSALFFIAATLSLSRNPAYIVHLAMRRIQTMVIQRQQRFFVAHKFWRRTWRIFLLVVCIQMNFFLLIALKHWRWMALSASFVAWGIGILAFSRWFSKRDMSKQFEEFVVRESPEFEQLVCQMIGR
ncbi:hypothetical protein LLG95_15805 [bacterium]|nr:hypothetical protein [bacterium]